MSCHAMVPQLPELMPSLAILDLLSASDSPVGVMRTAARKLCCGCLAEPTKEVVSFDTGDNSIGYRTSLYTDLYQQDETDPSPSILNLTDSNSFRSSNSGGNSNNANRQAVIESVLADPLLSPPTNRQLNFSGEQMKMRFN